MEKDTRVMAFAKIDARLELLKSQYVKTAKAAQLILDSIEMLEKTKKDLIDKQAQKAEADKK